MLIISACSWNDHKEAGAQYSLSGDEDSTTKLTSSHSRKIRSSIRAFVDTTFKNNSLNGSILVAKDGEILFEQYKGFAHYKDLDDSISNSSPFHLASVSKTITSVAILKLVQEGKLKLDDPISTYLSNFPIPAITVRLLLNHRSGLPNYVHYMERLGWNKKNLITNQDVLDFIVNRHTDIDIAPANRGFSYSNTNYALLALIIEKQSGMSYADYLKKTFFEPLGMTNSYIFSKEDSAAYMPSYFYGGKKYPLDFLDLVYGDKNIYSTVRDLLKFETSLVSGQLINDSLLTAAFSPYSFEKPGTHNYGVGWRMLLLKNGKKIIYHNGWWHGNRTALYYLPEQKVTIIALCNNDSKKIYSVRKMADLFGDYLQTGDKEEDSEKSIVTVSSRHRKKTLHSKLAVAQKSSRSLASKN